LLWRLRGRGLHRLPAPASEQKREQGESCDHRDEEDVQPRHHGRGGGRQTGFDLEGYRLRGLLKPRVVRGTELDGVCPVIRNFKRVRVGSPLGAIMANGQGSMKGKIFRLAHLGYYDAPDLFAVLAALEIVLLKAGQKIELGSGVRAAQEVYLQRAG